MLICRIKRLIKMKHLVLSLAFMLIGGLAMAQENNPNAPVIKFEKETIDYGTIERGANGVREFHFTNEGKEPLIITKATGSCGCTVPSWPREPIAPGESSVIKVKYDTKRVGPINKTVTVNSNASNNVKVLRIKGTVVKKKKPKTSPEKEGKASMMEQG